MGDVGLSAVLLEKHVVSAVWSGEEAHLSLPGRREVGRSPRSKQIGRQEGLQSQMRLTCWESASSQ